MQGLAINLTLTVTINFKFYVLQQCARLITDLKNELK